MKGIATEQLTPEAHLPLLPLRKRLAYSNWVFTPDTVNLSTEWESTWRSAELQLCILVLHLLHSVAVFEVTFAFYRTRTVQSFCFNVLCIVSECFVLENSSFSSLESEAIKSKSAHL
jgi:hypothetical protein